MPAARAEKSTCTTASLTDTAFSTSSASCEESLSRPHLISPDAEPEKRTEPQATTTPPPEYPPSPVALMEELPICHRSTSKESQSPLPSPQLEEVLSTLSVSQLPQNGVRRASVSFADERPTSGTDNGGIRSVKPSVSSSSDSAVSVFTSSAGGSVGDVRQSHQPPPRTPYERAEYAAIHDDRWRKELATGKRVGLYRLRGDLGSGNFSQVKLAVHYLTKRKVAVKTLDKSKLDAKTQRMLTREISIMEQMCHPGIIQLYEVLETESRVHLAVEYADGGELFAKITRDGRMGEEQCKGIFAQIVSAVDFMHSRNVVHRDLKSENVFFCGEDTVKVGDFGFGTTVSSVEQLLRTFCGSPPYAAPELFQEESYVGTPVDIWALGVLLYFMIAGYMPFRAQTVSGLKKLILECQYEIPSHVSIECAALIRGILRRNYRDRYTMAQLVDCAWLREHMEALGPTALRRQWGQRVASSKNAASKHMYHPWPRPEPQARDRQEIKVRGQLAELGIDENTLNGAVASGCRSPVIGIYRLLMHAAHRESQSGGGLGGDVNAANTTEIFRSEFELRPSLKDQSAIHLANQSAQPPPISKKKSAGSLSAKMSKTCSLL